MRCVYTMHMHVWSWVHKVCTLACLYSPPAGYLRTKDQMNQTETFDSSNQMQLVCPSLEFIHACKFQESARVVAHKYQISRDYLSSLKYK